MEQQQCYMHDFPYLCYMTFMWDNMCEPQHLIFLFSPKLKGRDDFQDNGTKKNHQQFSTNEDLGDVLIR